MFIFNTSNNEISNKIIYIFEIIILIVSIIIIIVGLLQNKKDQNSLSTLNGGNYELFASNKDRGINKIITIIMLIASIYLLIILTIICILNNLLF